jgi:hypothetical protein
VCAKRKKGKKVCAKRKKGKKVCAKRKKGRCLVLFVKRRKVSVERK